MEDSSHTFQSMRADGNILISAVEILSYSPPGRMSLISLTVSPSIYTGTVTYCHTFTALLSKMTSPVV